MNPDQIRAAMGAITEKLGAIVQAESGYTAEQVAEIEAMNTEFEALATQLETAERVESMKAKAGASQGRKVAPAPTVAVTRVEVGKSAKDRFGGFDNSGEFLMAVKRAGTHSEVDKRLLNVATERSGEDGGFLVPEEVSQAIITKLQANESLLAATTQMPISGNALTLTLDESQPWNSGVQAYWTADGTAITGVKPKFTQASWRLQKLAALVTATDELLDDATALASYINVAAPNAIMHKLNNAIINGNGVGKPQGIINSPFTIQVGKESMQDPDTVVTRNIINMYSAMIPAARANAVWYVNAMVEPQLMTLKDDNDNFLYISPGGFGQQINNSPYGMLLGRPVVPLLSGMPELGDSGDILFANLSYYYTIQKAQGVKSASSIHLNFDKELTSFRFSLRVDGKCPFLTPVTTEFGGYQVSGFVKLESR